jgi:hypothetical protein
MLDFNELKEPKKTIVAENPKPQDVEPNIMPIVVKQSSFRWMDVAVFAAVIAILGLLLVERVPQGFDSNRDEVINNDDQKKEDRRDDKNKSEEVKQGDSLVLVAERGDGIAPDILEVSDLLRAYCESKTIGFRFYDTDMKSSEPYVSFAASKSIKPPFVSIVRSGKPVDCKTIEEIKGLIK